MRIDSTYPEVDFSFSRHGGSKVSVTTLEEAMYPAHYFRRANPSDATPAPRSASEIGSVEPQSTPTRAATAEAIPSALKEGHRMFAENQRGVNFELLFGPYLRGAKKIRVTDPYIRLFYQARNLMEFVETVVQTESA